MFRNIIVLMSDELNRLGHIAIISGTPIHNHVLMNDMVIGRTAAARLFEACRSVPYNKAAVALFIDKLAHVTILNQPNLFGETTMNIFDQMHAAIDKKPEFPLLMVAPISVTIPEDGMLTYRTIETIGDLLIAPKATEVVLFREDQKELLETLCEKQHLFGVDVIVVTGLPGTTYSAEFESVTWDKPKLPYHTVVNDLLEANRRVEDTAADVRESSIYGKEQSKYVRKTGETKVFTSFEEPPTDSEISDRDE